MIFRENPVESLQGNTLDHWRNYSPEERLAMGQMLVSSAITSAANTMSDRAAAEMAQRNLGFAQALAKDYAMETV